MEATAYVFLLSKRTIPWINCGSSACIIRCKEKNDSVLFPDRVFQKADNATQRINRYQLSGSVKKKKHTKQRSS